MWRCIIIACLEKYFHNYSGSSVLLFFSLKHYTKVVNLVFETFYSFFISFFLYHNKIELGNTIVIASISKLSWTVHT